jgi:hypothetical protein
MGTSPFCVLWMVGLPYSVGYDIESLAHIVAMILVFGIYLGTTQNGQQPGCKGAVGRDKAINQSDHG